MTNYTDNEVFLSSDNQCDLQNLVKYPRNWFLLLMWVDVYGKPSMTKVGCVRSVFSMSLAMLLKKNVRYFTRIQRSSKGEHSIGILCKYRRKTGVHYFKGNDRATSRDWNELVKYSNMPWNFRPNTTQTKDRVWSGKQFHRYYGWRIRQRGTTDPEFNAI